MKNDTSMLADFCRRLWANRLAMAGLLVVLCLFVPFWPWAPISYRPSTPTP